jgi:hypothetical protein
MFKDTPMSAKEIANENWVASITPNAGSIPASQQAITWMLTKSSKSKAGSASVLTQMINWTVSSNLCTFAGFPVHSGSISTVPITATAAKTKCDNMPVLRAGDIGNCTCMFTNPSSGATTAASCKFEISAAGQLAAKGS